MSQRYKVPITIAPLEDGSYMARCEVLRATATGDTSEEAMKNLREAITEMVYEFGEARRFRCKAFSGHYGHNQDCSFCA